MNILFCTQVIGQTVGRTFDAGYTAAQSDGFCDDKTLAWSIGRRKLPAGEEGKGGGTGRS